ncbi:uncharacterized protein BDZ99DRAFT_337469, partial [Mytilinidion resinicola]
RHTEAEEGKERPDKCIDTEQVERLWVYTQPGQPRRRRREAILTRKSLFFEGREGGAPVFIAVRCIAATKAAGTAYDVINQSINQ